MSRAPRGRAVQAAAIRVERQVMFWAAAFASLMLALWLLSGILLPFIVGFAIAFLLTPLTDRLERIGLHRAVAALLIVMLV
ncbi:MAG: AI-2E family transporter, partial [Pseudolabrys sp.]|nr:AI-2E family transporter [Pseudolabrys sp.]